MLLQSHLAAHLLHVNVHGPGFPREAIPPDRFQQPFPGEEKIRILQEKYQHVEFLGRQIDLAPADDHRAVI